MSAETKTLAEYKMKLPQDIESTVWKALKLSQLLCNDDVEIAVEADWMSVLAWANRMIPELGYNRSVAWVIDSAINHKECFESAKKAISEYESDRNCCN